MKAEQEHDDVLLTDDPDVFRPVPVKLDPVQVGAPEFGTTSRFVVGPSQAVQLLPAARKRSAATIKCNSVSGGAAKLIVGSLGQVGNGSPGAALNGYEMTAGDSLTYNAQQALYAICDTAAQTINVSVLDQRYQ